MNKAIVRLVVPYGEKPCAASSIFIEKGSVFGEDDVEVRIKLSLSDAVSCLMQLQSELKKFSDSMTENLSITNQITQALRIEPENAS